MYNKVTNEDILALQQIAGEVLTGSAINED